MKTKRLLFPAALLFTLARVAGQAVIDNGTELIVPGLYDSGTAMDIAIVDKQSGQVRTGISSGTALAWTAPLLSGLADVTDATSGKLGLPLNEGLLLIARAGNRLARVAPLDASSPPVVYPRPGPSGAVALDFAGSSPSSNTNGLWLASADFAPSATPEVINLVTPSSTALSATSGGQGYNHRMSFGQRVRMNASGNVLAAFSAPQDGRVFLMQSVASGIPAFPWRPSVAMNCSGLPSGVRFSHEYWLTGGQALLLFHAPGNSRVYHIPAATGNSTVTSNVDTGMSIGFTVSLNAAGAQGFIAFPQDAGPAKYFVWNGTGFTLQQTIPAPAGGRWTGALPGANLMLLHGPARGSGTTGWQHWPLQGNGQFVFASGGTVPGRVMAMSAHVFAFTQEPFVGPSAMMTDARRVTDWTSGALALPVNRVMNVNRETYAGANAGLGSPTAFNAGTAPAGSAWMLTNQYTADTSVVALSSETITFSVPTVEISPKPRHLEVLNLNTPVSDTITFTASGGATVFYRTAPSQSFSTYGPATPPVITVTALPQTSIVEYYALAGGVQSRLFLASYTYGAAPAISTPSSADADGNGLADAWERYYGLTDPNGDPDGDGLNNLTEQNNGSDPLGPCHPAEFPDVTMSSTGKSLRIDFSRPLVPGETLEASADLGTWLTIPVAPNATSVTLPQKGTRRFYRITGP